MTRFGAWLAAILWLYVWISMIVGLFVSLIRDLRGRAVCWPGGRRWRQQWKDDIRTAFRWPMWLGARLKGIKR